MKTLAVVVPSGLAVFVRSHFREVHHPDVVRLAVADRPLDGVGHVRGVGLPLFVRGLEIQQIRLRGEAEILPLHSLVRAPPPAVDDGQAVW